MVDEIATPPDAIEPSEWFVVFHTKAMNRVFSALACGRFKHVSALGYCAGFKAWLLFDPQWSGLRITLHSHDAMRKFFADYSRGCAVVKIARSTDAMRLSSRLGFYCVPAIKQLLGLRSGALRPSALYRQLLRNGGVLIDAGQPSANSG